MNRATWIYGACIAAAFSVGCARPHVTSPSAPSVRVVRLSPDRAWTDTHLVVTRGERLTITASGEIFWRARGIAAGPNGINGNPPWPLGDGALVARVAGDRHVIDVGERDRPVPSYNGRIGRKRLPGPLRMPASGTLELGFKNFADGPNQGSFEVTIRQ